MFSCLNKVIQIYHGRYDGFDGASDDFDLFIFSDVGKMGKLEDDSWGDWLHLLSGQPCRLPSVRMGNDYERKINVLVPVLVGISLFSEWNC